MNILANISISVAAAAAFFFVEPYLLGLTQPWRTIATLVVLLAAGGLAYLFLRNLPSNKDEGRLVMAKNEAGKDLELVAGKLDATQGQGKIASENKSGGSMKINITDSKI